MPVIDAIRPRTAQRIAGGGRADRIVADLRAPLRMRRNGRAKMLRQHLRAKADAEKRALLGKRHRDPVDLARDVIVRIVGAHRAAEDHRARMIGERRRQLVTKARAPNVERISKRAERIADAARRRGFLMQHDQHRQRIVDVRRMAVIQRRNAARLQLSRAIGIRRPQQHRCSCLTRKTHGIATQLN